MSNTTVGGVYAQIITDVIDTSRIDFEEMGVEESVLEDLKKGWQRKLTQLNVAQFPWDPKPEAAQPAPPQAAPQPTAAAPSYTQAQLNPAQNAQQSLSFPGAPVQQHNGNVPQIKTEPGLIRNDAPIKHEPGMVNNGMPGQHPGFPTGPGTAGMTPAQIRAAQQLESQYGQRAAASINAIHNGMAQAAPLNRSQHQGQHQGPPQGHPQSQGHVQAQGQAQLQGQRPGQPQQQQPFNAQQYRQGLAASMAAQQQHQQQQQRAQQAQLAQQTAHANGQNGANNSQMDGSSEAYEGVLMQRDADGNPVEMGRLEIDRLLHDQIASRAKQMEGGGLMLPLKEATKHRSVAKKSKPAAGPSQVDGLDDDIKDEDIDEDAINSDLDDPNDDQEDDDDDDDSMGHIMLCMYDKVQRVKNKWKCTLKDGVLTVNGKEYVFHKATGEYEW